MLKRFTALFCLTLLLLAWCSKTLDDQQTPRVYCTAPSAGTFADDSGEIQSYSAVLLKEALHFDQDGACAIYVASDSSSFFSPVVTKAVSVYVMAETPDSAAVTGLPSNEKRIILYANRPLTGNAEAVRIWDDERNSARGWVEVYCASDERALRQAAESAEAELRQMGLDIRWEKNHLVCPNAGLFTAQQVKTVLVRTGMNAEQMELRDYSWANAVLEQSRRLWQPAAALAAMLLSVRASAIVLRSYRERCAAGKDRRTCKKMQYVRYRPTDILLVMGTVILCLVLVHRLWRIEPVLPTGFLPNGSIFVTSHYRQWWRETFPRNGMSAAAQDLLSALHRAHLLAAVEAVVLLTAAVLLPAGKEKKKGN